MKADGPTSNGASYNTGLLLWAACLSIVGVIVFVVGFILYDSHGTNAHDDWRHRPAVIMAVVAGPLCILTACILCLLAVIQGGIGFARAALIAALTGLGIILVIVWLSCGAFDRRPMPIPNATPVPSLLPHPKSGQ